MFKIMLVCNYTAGVGHLFRTIALAKNLRENNHNCKVLIVSGGEPIKQLQIPRGIKFINLPAIRDGGKKFHIESTQNLPLRAANKIRKEKLIKIARIFKPDTLFVELFPFGRHYITSEIIPLIRALRTLNPSITVVSNIRDSLHLEFLGSKRMQDKKIKSKLKFFDFILIHGEPKFSDIEKEFRFLQNKDFKKKIAYCGYITIKSKKEITDRKVIRQRLDISNEKLIVISGGGRRDTFAFFKKVILSKKILDRKIKSKFLVSTGPFLSKEEFNQLNKLRKKEKGVVLKRFIPSFIDYLNAGDLSISLAGYNTCAEILLTNKKSILVPNKGSMEQMARAKMMMKRGISLLIPFSKLDPKIIASNVLSLLKNDKKIKNEFNLNPAICLTEFLNIIKKSKK